MPIKVKQSLPARDILEKENIFVMTETRAMTQDIRPLKVLVLNLMPTKIVTETQILRKLSNTPLQIEVEFLQTATYRSKHTDKSHLDDFLFMLWCFCRTLLSLWHKKKRPCSKAFRNL